MKTFHDNLWGFRMDVNANSRLKQATIEAVITRADGTVENLGVVSYWHRNWWRRAAWRVSQFLKGK